MAPKVRKALRFENFDFFFFLNDVVIKSHQAVDDPVGLERPHAVFTTIAGCKSDLRVSILRSVSIDNTNNTALMKYFVQNKNNTIRTRRISRKSHEKLTSPPACRR